jgi:hypothetical protein
MHGYGYAIVELMKTWSDQIARNLCREVAMEQVFRDALEAAKSAAKGYSRQPSVANAEEVDAAWRRIRALHKVAQWRRSPDHSGARLFTRPPSVAALEQRSPA